MFAAAAQENLDDLVDDEQSDGEADAEQPLVAAQGSQAQTALQEVKLGRQDDEQQGQAVEHHLVSIVQEIPDWERAQCFTVAADAVADNEE